MQMMPGWGEKDGMFGLRFVSVRVSAVFLGAMAMAFVSIAGGAEAQDSGKPRLGLSLRDLSPDTAYEYGVPIPGGLEVGKVSRGSPAEAAGILPGDIIIMVDHRKILDTPALMEAMERVRPGKTMQVSLLRRGELLHLPVNLWKPEPEPPAPTPATQQAEPPHTAPDRQAEAPRASERQTEAPRAPEADKLWLGVSTADITPEEAAGLRLGKPGGAKVVSVAKGSPLGEMGVKPGDVIVKLDGRVVTDSHTLDTTLAGKQPGTQVMLSYVRDGNTRYLAIKLGQRPETGGGQKEADTEPATAGNMIFGAPAAAAERPQESGDRSEPAGNTVFGVPVEGESAPAPSARPADAERSQETRDRPETAGNTIFGAPANAEPGR
jgi:predicted metalloprotease with PDZ domain